MSGDLFEDVHAQDEHQSDLLRLLHREQKHPAPEQLAKINKFGRDLDYMGHADVTDALLAHDPLWNWEPLAMDDNGLPRFYTKDGVPVGLWIRLTVHGHTRLGFGSCLPGASEPVKELIGDALRNAAMRFGVGLALWSKAGEA